MDGFVVGDMADVGHHGVITMTVSLSPVRLIDLVTET